MRLHAINSNEIRDEANHLIARVYTVADSKTFYLSLNEGAELAKTFANSLVLHEALVKILDEVNLCDVSDEQDVQQTLENVGNLCRQILNL